MISFLLSVPEGVRRSLLVSVPRIRARSGSELVVEVASGAVAC